MAARRNRTRADRPGPPGLPGRRLLTGVRWRGDPQLAEVVRGIRSSVSRASRSIRCAVGAQFSDYEFESCGPHELSAAPSRVVATPGILPRLADSPDRRPRRRVVLCARWASWLSVTRAKHRVVRFAPSLALLPRVASGCRPGSGGPDGWRRKSRRRGIFHGLDRDLRPFGSEYQHRFARGHTRSVAGAAPFAPIAA